MLASNMQSVANAHNLPIKVAAFSHNKLEEIIEKDTPDCILLGPQVKYMYEETVEQFGNTGIPIAVIDQADYGMMNGEKVLKSAIKLIKSNKNRKRTSLMMKKLEKILMPLAEAIGRNKYLMSIRDGFLFQLHY